MFASEKQPLAACALFCACLLLLGLGGCEVNDSPVTAEAGLCGCGVEQVEQYSTLDDLARRLYPGTSDDVYAVIEDSLVECNSWVLGGVEKGGRVVLPCLFPEEQELRPKLAAPERDCGCGDTHEVVAEESIWSVARTVYPNLDPLMVSHMLLSCNPGVSPQNIRKGQVLQMFCVDQHLERTSSLKPLLQGIRGDQRKLLQKKKMNADKYFIEEGCPVCDVPLFTQSKKITDKKLPVCGCDNDCAQCAVNFVNGCTGPFADRIEGLFEDTVRPACFAHDACYSCGYHFLKKRGEDSSDVRKKCDDRMLENMQKRCQAVYRKESRLLTACRLTSSAYHEASRAFGGRFFVEECKCPDGWEPYVRNLFMMDFCASPVIPDFSLQRDEEKNGK